MKLSEALTPVLGSPSRLGLLRTMYAAPERGWTGRELARAARVSTAQAARDLGELADTAVVSREVVGRSYLWRLNPSHVLHPVLVELFQRESECRSALLQTISEGLRHPGIERAWVFGSVSRGEERADSDVDLFLQIRTRQDRAEAERAVGRVRARVWKQFGNPLTALVYTRAEAARPKNPDLLRSIEEEGLEVRGGV